jgi:hypothetical protein
MSDPAFLDTHQLIAALRQQGVKSSPRTVERWCAAGMPYWLMANRRRFKPEATLAWLENGFKRERNPAPQRRCRRAA